MSSFQEFRDKQLEDPELRAEYDALEAEYAIVRAVFAARRETGLTQRELAEKSGISQADICKIETGNGNPTLKTLQRLAGAMGKNLKIEFVAVDGE